MEWHSMKIHTRCGLLCFKPFRSQNFKEMHLFYLTHSQRFFLISTTQVKTQLQFNCSWIRLSSHFLLKLFSHWKVLLLSWCHCRALLTIQFYFNPLDDVQRGKLCHCVYINWEQSFAVYPSFTRLSPSIHIFANWDIFNILEGCWISLVICRSSSHLTKN